ncbi:Protein of unknown function DUF1264 [Phaffia rhodozyma]|uniref:DUF1264-domain-containing protein n=1 Tax=Phaffia rhodozyma TaxID=264483 RepID=A0A0F7STB5_PHARH|nr:Protein of unknown function DUF1264 [Phaffia rhodozyma]
MSLASVSDTINSAVGVIPTTPFKPLQSICQHFCAFHAYANDLSRHVESHHFCTHLSPDFHQCLIYDGPGDGEGKFDGRRLIGIEYIVTEKVFNTLPESETQYWHSHNYEVSSGMLTLLGMKGVPGLATSSAEQPAMIELQKTYGKTIHTWQSDIYPDLPLGPPQLMVSYTGPNQLPGHLIEKRDKQYGIDTAEQAKKREGYLDMEFEPSKKADLVMNGGKKVSLDK